ncbi:MAG: TetR family transcriptional regulator [Mycobacteriaceae bacterium]|nr:TetR family transcriptional regulator [Mycobacteriaceae bacterium]
MVVRDSVPTRKRRPRDRKEQILRAAAVAFSEHGYHRVGVNEIAAEVGISGPALYRHFPNKYALFLATAEAAADGLVAATAGASNLAGVLAALIDFTIDNRAGGGLYRWEGRYLDAVDRGRLRTTYGEVNDRVAVPLRTLRPKLADADVAMLAAAALSAIGSITAHHTASAAPRIAAVLHEMCWAVVQSELPAAERGKSVRFRPAAPPDPDADRSEQLIDVAIGMFAARGYHDASVEELASAVGMTASGVYRHFPSKADLLAAALDRANDRLTEATGDALAAEPDPRRALTALAERYLGLSFSVPDLLSVYFAEFGNLPQEHQRRLRGLQRGQVGRWVALLTAARPEIGPDEAAFRVHAAFGLVLDLGRLTSFDNRPANRSRIHRLMTAALLD